MDTGLNTAEWYERKQSLSATVEDMLPSGLKVIRRQRVSIEALVFSGQLPLVLLNELQSKNGNDDGTIEVDLDELTEKLQGKPDDDIQAIGEIVEYMDLVNAVFAAALISPKIGKETDLDNDTLALSEFDDYVLDKVYITRQVMEETEALRPFRTSNGKARSSAPPKPRVRKPAKRPAKNSG